VVQERFAETAFVDLAEEHRPHVMAATPTVFLRIAAEGTSRSVRVEEMQACIAGGASLEAKAAAQLVQMFPNATVRQIYGMTEIRTVTGSRPEQNAPASSMGKVIPGVNLRLVDGAGNTVTKPGEVGELVAHSPGVMRGYLSGERDAFLPGGWMRTGDLASFDEDGWYYFSGRTKEMITRGGANVYPREIEEALTTVEGVGEVAVVGAKHPDLGEVPVAFYVLAPGALPPDEETLRAVARERLAAFKVPVAFHRVVELPRNAAGKVTKRVLVPPEDNTPARS
jgi:acyl-CoA synthetase (AMP-forming)/AMP-acid ligase II